MPKTPSPNLSGFVGMGPEAFMKTNFVLFFSFEARGCAHQNKIVSPSILQGRLSRGGRGAWGPWPSPPPPISSQNISTSESLDLTICWEICTQTSIETPTSEAFFQLNPPPPPPAPPSQLIFVRPPLFYLPL